MKPVVIIGGGISGITAALELSEAGKEVILVEKEAWLGGNVVRMHNYFPKLCPPACGLEINFRRIRSNPRIKVLTHTTVTGIEGEKGNFHVTVRTGPRMVSDMCTSCGDCVDVCPEERPDAFNYNFGTTRAIYLPHALAYPQVFNIDTEVCKGSACAKCVSACTYDAIDLNATVVEETLEAHAVVSATGWKHYDAGKIEGLNYLSSPDIVTNVEFERLLSLTGPGKGKLAKPSDGSEPRKIAFVQCAGSRDENHLPYCSAVCCSASLKHALNVAELNKENSATIFYIDLRVTGRNEDFLAKVEQNSRINLVKGKVAKIEAGGEGLVVIAEDITSGKKVHENFDLVVLATGIVPNSGPAKFSVNKDGFLTGDQDAGLRAAACARKPMDVSASVKDATAAALAIMK